MSALGLNIDARTIELLAAGTHPEQEFIERNLVMLARSGALAGVVTKPPRYSATTIQWYVDCQRKFYWPTLAGLESPPSPQQKFGTTLHTFQERYLKAGEVPPRTSPESILAAIGLPLLPMPNTPGLYVEQPFEMRFDGIPVAITGTRDFGVDPIDKDAKGFLLGDHKTQRSRRYPKTKQWLHGNIQANLYAFTKWAELAARGYDQLQVVDKQWIYYFKDERQADKLRVVDGLDHVGEEFEQVIKPAVLGMATLAQQAPKISDVPLPSDRSVCDQYGGCPHRARCFGFGHQQKESGMGSLAGKFNKQALAEKAGAIKAGAGAAINPPKAPPVKAAPVVEREEETAGNLPFEESEGADATEQQPAEDTPPKATRTRKPKGATEKVAEVAAQTEKAFAARTPGKSATTPGSNSAHDFWLFVGCAPAKGFDAPQVFVEEIVGAAQANAATRLGTDHYRAGANNYGVLEACFAAWLEENALAGAVVVDPNTIVARDVIGLLRAHANVVIERRQ